MSADEPGALPAHLLGPDGTFAGSDADTDAALSCFHHAHLSALELHRSLDRDRDTGTPRGAALDMAGAFDLASGRAGELYRALSFDRYLGITVGLDPKPLRELAHHLYLGINSARDRALDLAGTTPGNTADEFRSLLAERARLRAGAAEIAIEIATKLGWLPPASEVATQDATGKALPRAGHITPLAGRLLRAASRILPPTERARYCEEYRSELWEIADAGASRWQQIQYALRQLTRVACLRSAVAASRRRRVGIGDEDSRRH